MTDAFKQFETIKVEIQAPVAQVVLNRPEVKNAMSFQMVRDLQAAFETLRENRAIRCIVLSGEGGTFCAGGDINELRDAFTNPTANSTGNAVNMDAMLNAVNTAPQVVVAKIEGTAFGGGLGLVCVSDIAIASQEARFAMPEVRLGLVPSFISPYVMKRIGLTRARELMLTGRRFDGKQAQEYGLVHQVCAVSELDSTVQDVVKQVCQGSPNALTACKRLIFEIMDKDLEATVEYRAQLLDELRRSEEAQEGMMAFIEKRPARWVQE
jgi:enoyl-CoA hydratase/carnithine racemase